jgi:hypothetical protein
MSTLQTYRNMLRINKHRLDDELEIQAELQERISAQVARLNSQMLEAKDDLAKVEARLTEDYREESKATKDTVEAKVKRHPDRQAAWEKFQMKRADHEEWAGLLEAWKVKGFSIRELCELYGSQYFALSSHQTRHREERPVVRPDRSEHYRVERDETSMERGIKALQAEETEVAPRRKRVAT